MSNVRELGLTREDVIVAAKEMGDVRRAKWAVMVEGRALPARPLVLKAMGAFPNDPTNSHKAVKILQGLGFEIRYEGREVPG